jgi:hypothetical protein
MQLGQHCCLLLLFYLFKRKGPMHRSAPTLGTSATYLRHSKVNVNGYVIWSLSRLRRKKLPWETSYQSQVGICLPDKAKPHKRLRLSVESKASMFSPLFWLLPNTDSTFRGQLGRRGRFDILADLVELASNVLPRYG